VTTDAQGRAAGQGFRPNNVQGNFELQVTATASGATATAAIHMQNVGGAGVNPGHAAGHAKLIAILVAFGVAATTGVAYALSDHGAPAAATPPATTITAGTGVVGARP
jgi:hypothetical protein